MSSSSRIAGGLAAIVVGIVALFIVVGGLAWVVSFRGVDSGEVAIVREGGPFDGRAIKEIRQPGSGPKAIGAFNHQDSLPATQRDLTEEAGRIVVPTADGVNVVVDGQALFQLRTDPDLVKKFYKNFGRRKWDGKQLSDEKGWVNFLKIRLVPILYQSIRQTLGTKDCVALNNTCVYVLNAESILASSDQKKASEAQQKAKEVNVSQNLAEAETSITEAFKANLKAGLGDEYFEGVRFQNLKVGFSPGIQARVESAQAKRAEVAEARLNAQRQAAQAKGDADARVEQAIGERKSKEEQAAGARALAGAYNENPALAEVEKLKALCGVAENGEPKGCDNLQVLGGGNVIKNLGK